MWRNLWLELGREMTLLWMTQAIVQLKFSLAILHKNVQPGLACTTRPHIDNVFNVLEEESLFRLTEGNHVADLNSSAIRHYSRSIITIIIFLIVH